MSCRRKARSVLAPLVLFPVLLTACSPLIRLAEWPGREIVDTVEARNDNRAPDPVLLQEQLMRFSDSYRAAVLGATHDLRQNGKPLAPELLLSVKLRYSQDVLAVTTGPNPFANLLDMVIVVTMIRQSLQAYWMPRFWGASAEPLLAVCREQEQAIWRLAASVLSPAERDELKKAIQTWHASHPTLKTLDQVRATGFATEIAKYGRSPQDAAGSVFDLLDIDPLADLDPAARELAQTRQFAERALYLAQRTPTLLRWQADLLAMSIGQLPEVQRGLAEAGRLSDAAARLSAVAEQLPADLGRERAALVASLRGETSELGTLSDRVRSTFQAGGAMAAATDKALQSFSGVYATMRTAGAGEGGGPTLTPDDYRAMLADAAAAADRVDHALLTLRDLAATSDSAAHRHSIEHLADELEQRANRLVENAARVGARLIGLSCVGLLLSLIVYRWTATLIPARKPKVRSPES